MNKNHYKHPHIKNVSGVSLIELMVAMAIGLVLMAGIYNMFVNSLNSQKIVQEEVHLVDEARVTLDIMKRDLLYMGLWGKSKESRKIITQTVVDLGPPGNDCDLLGGTAGSRLIGTNDKIQDVGWALDYYRPFWASNDTYPYNNCVVASPVANTDTLEIRYAFGEPVQPADIQAGTIYLANFRDPSTNSIEGEIEFFLGPAVPVPTDPTFVVDIYKYDVIMYYISDWTDFVGDNLPSLRRVSLQDGPRLVEETLVPGVENMQIQFGVDEDQDGSIERYVNADLFNGAAPTVQVPHIKSAQLTLILRSQKYLPENPAFTFDLPGAPGDTINYAQDGFKRVKVTSVIEFRNVDVDGNLAN